MSERVSRALHRTSRSSEELRSGYKTEVLFHDRSYGVTEDRRARFLQSGFTSGRRRTQARTHAQCYFTMTTMMVIDSAEVIPGNQKLPLVVSTPGKEILYSSAAPF